jgi:membrane-bound lytic murein transglycosylase B
MDMARVGHHLGRIAAGALIACAATACAATADYEGRAEVRAFIDDMAAKHDFASEELTRLFGQAAFRQDIIDAMTRPAERRPWHSYRPIFITERRIDGGVEFWREHEEILQRAEERFGVPPEFVTAIIGVETSYGRNTGRHRVLDSLATLAFDYPPRGSFFRGELEQYLILAREEHFDPLELTGSYAGAMGKPQFIPSSYRHYAIDFDGDGQRDLFNSIADVVGSVANYFKVHGWAAGAPVVSPATVRGENYRTLIERGIKPHTSAGEFAAFGVETAGALPADAPATLIELEGGDGQEYWVALNNFYVITRYNRSSLYAMAVYQLAEEIRTRHAASVQAGGKP